VDACGRITHAARSRWLDALRPGDLVIANDAATLPASLMGRHVLSGRHIEVRLAGRRSLERHDVHEFLAIVFGDGDFRIRTEERPLPPPLFPGDRLQLGPLRATVLTTLGHPRLIGLRFTGAADEIWAGLARHGRPIQYAHVPEPLALWDVWTVLAAPPVAFEPPSAGFVFDWRTVAEMRRRSIELATLTHAAGISSTGDALLDAHLPFDEPYEIPVVTAAAIDRARREQRRVIAVGTTVVRALEHAARDGHVVAGTGLANRRVDRHTVLHVVNAILTGVHEPSTSHYELLRAFVEDEILRLIDREVAQGQYRTHEFGDSLLIEATARQTVVGRAS
jgi:S-adenosylmethionine:tRNA ribosyltransferase-isomerase